MAVPKPEDVSDDWAIFRTIESTYPLASDAEQRAMVQQLRHRLPAIPLTRRQELIDAIERAIGENLEWQEPEL